MHVTAEECHERRQWYDVIVNGARVDYVIEASDDEGFAILTDFQDMDDEGDPGPAIVLFGAVDLVLLEGPR